MDGISAMSAQAFAVSYDMALLKKTMENVSAQAMAVSYTHLTLPTIYSV